MSKKCTPLWREAHFQVKMHKTHQVRSTFRSWDVEKVHAIVVRRTCQLQNAQDTPGSEHFFWSWCRKSVRRCGAKHISKSKCTKHLSLGASWDVQKVYAVVARSTFRSQNAQNTSAPEHFWKLRCGKGARRCGSKHDSKSKRTKHHMFAPLLDVVLRGRRKGLCTLSKVSKTPGFVAFPKTMAGMGHLKRVCKDAFSVAGAVQETCSSRLAQLAAMLAPLGAMLAHLGAMLAHLGGYVGPSWGYVGPSWGYVGTSCGPCRAIWRLCWASFGAFWGLCWAMLAHLDRKNGKHCKLRGFWWVGSRGRSPSLLRRGEKAYGSATRRAIAAPGWVLELTPMVRSAGLLDPRCHHRVFLKAIEWVPAASEIYSLCFFWTYSWNHGTAFFGGASGEGLFPKAPGKAFSERIAANFNFPLRVQVPLCKDFSV